MRKASVEVTLGRFFDGMDLYIDLLNITIADDSPFSRKQEKIEVLEGFVFKLCSLWEVLVEDVLIDCLNRDSSAYASYMGLRLPRHIPRPQCEAMIVGLGYFDSKGVPDMKGTAKHILVDEFNPFSAIRKNDGDKIDEFFRIRNYLAHHSITAERSLKKLYENVYKLKQFRQPGDFLLSYDRKVRGPRMQHYINSFNAAAESMAEKLSIPPDDAGDE